MTLFKCHLLCRKGEVKKRSCSSSAFLFFFWSECAVRSERHRMDSCRCACVVSVCCERGPWGQNYFEHFGAWLVQCKPFYVEVKPRLKKKLTGHLLPWREKGKRSSTTWCLSVHIPVFISLLISYSLNQINILFELLLNIWWLFYLKIVNMTNYI